MLWLVETTGRREEDGMQPRWDASKMGCQQDGIPASHTQSTVQGQTDTYVYNTHLISKRVACAIDCV